MNKSRASAAPSLPRREFLQAGGALVVGFSLPAPALAQRQPGADAALGKSLDTNAVDGFISINADGTVTIWSGKVDLGQGLRIAIPQMAAEELGIGVERIVMIEGDTALTPDQGPTAGSSGIMRGGIQIRQAAATARETLIAMVAARANAPAAEFDTVDGEVRLKTGGAGIRFDQLVGAKRFDVKVDPKAKLRDPASYTVVGKSVARPDIPGKVTGRHVYVHDVKVDGMLHGASCGRRRSAPSSSPWMTHRSRGFPEPRVVRVNDFVGVVAASEWDAIAAAKLVKTRWSDSTPLMGTAAVRGWLRAGSVRVGRDAGEERRRDRRARRRCESHGGVLLADAIARLDGAVLRGGRRARRQGDDMVGIAGHAPLPRNDFARAGVAQGDRCASSISTVPAVTE